MHITIPATKTKTKMSNRDFELEMLHNFAIAEYGTQAELLEFYGITRPKLHDIRRRYTDDAITRYGIALDIVNQINKQFTDTLEVKMNEFDISIVRG